MVESKLRWNLCIYVSKFLHTIKDKSWKLLSFMERETRLVSCSLAFNGNFAFCSLDFVQSQNCSSLSSLALELHKELLATKYSRYQQKRYLCTSFFDIWAWRDSNSHAFALVPKTSVSTIPPHAQASYLLELIHYNKNIIYCQRLFPFFKY